MAERSNTRNTRTNWWARLVYLTLGVGFAGAVIGASYGGFAWRPEYGCSGSDFEILCFSRGDYMTMYGVFGVLSGAVLGLLAWVVWWALPSQREG